MKDAGHRLTYWQQTVRGGWKEKGLYGLYAVSADDRQMRDTPMNRDRHGNPFAPGVPYARGALVTSTSDDLVKLRTAWKVIKDRWERLGADSLYLLSGLERGLRLDPVDLRIMDDELASALFIDELTRLGLDHFGGDPAKHDVMVLNRLTAALLVAADVMIKPDDTVIGVSPRYSHPAVVRAVAHARGNFHDTTGLAEFKAALDAADRVDAVFITRLSVSYEILSERDLRDVVRMAREYGASIIVDDAGGARVGPAVFDQPRTLELDVDVCATGLDKYGTTGPRLGLLGGRSDIVEQIRCRAFEMGLEARQMLYPAVVQSLRNYRPERVRELVATTRIVADELRKRLGGDRLFETPVTVQLKGEDILELAMERGDMPDPPVVPYEATSGLAMLLLRNHGIVTVHFAGVPPGTSALMFKFVPQDTLARLGGPDTLAEAVDDCITELAEILKRPDDFKSLIMGAGDRAGED